ncbi:MAG: hypothetical protein ACFNOP_06330, partial [Bacteroides sp.]
TTKKAMKVGMVTDAGTIDDKSFNQGTWEGIGRSVGSQRAGNPTDKGVQRAAPFRNSPLAYSRKRRTFAV